MLWQMAAIGRSETSVLMLFPSFERPLLEEAAVELAARCGLTRRCTGRRAVPATPLALL